MSDRKRAGRFTSSDKSRAAHAPQNEYMPAVIFTINEQPFESVTETVNPASLFGPGVLLKDVTTCSEAVGVRRNVGADDSDEEEELRRKAARMEQRLIKKSSPSAVDVRGVVLLPHPTTGDVTVHHGHAYTLVRFFGRHLLSAGAFREDASSPSLPLPVARTNVEGSAFFVSGFTLYCNEQKHLNYSAAAVAWKAMAEEQRQAYTAEAVRLRQMKANEKKR